MREHALQIDLPDDESPGIWPWVIGLVAFATLLFTVANTAASIPNAMENRAASIPPIPGALVAVSGRDITVSGTIEPTANRADYILKLASIPGVRTVNDLLTVSDPAAEARQRKLEFQQTIASMDTSGVAFEPNSASLTTSSEQVLLNLASALKENPDFRIRVAGHTDNTGRPEVNLRISRRRAGSVAQFLTAQGVNPDQVLATGYGASKPIADNNTEAGRAKNRRIEIRYVD
ncbi:MAG: OmpA family protein [Gammaproteobacteria bacterium]|nr:OmpA family protein [Gammaproteobacteria bacterium]